VYCVSISLAVCALPFPHNEGAAHAGTGGIGWAALAAWYDVVGAGVSWIKSVDIGAVLGWVTCKCSAALDVGDVESIIGGGFRRDLKAPPAGLDERALLLLLALLSSLLVEELDGGDVERIFTKGSSW
jgi:hypothetical protein